MPPLNEPLVEIASRVQDLSVMDAESRRPLPPMFLRSLPRLVSLLPFLACLILATVPRTHGATAADARKKLLAGDYEGVRKTARAAVAADPSEEAWQRLHVEALLALGRYPEADAAMTNALGALPRSLSLRWLARDAFRSNGRPAQAREIVAELARLMSQRPWAYRDPADLVAFGRAMLALGTDPKEVLDKIFTPLKKAAPELRDVYLAGGELSLSKHDYALAARQFDEALKKFPDDPDLHAGRARAFLDGDRKEMSKSLEAALKLNPRHVPSLLLLAEHYLDAEDYDESSKTLVKIRDVNPVHPEAWAFAAVIAHLRNDAAAETSAVTNALAAWARNPDVPHLIGRKLSAKYRFAEGAAQQRAALRFDPEYIPAKAQLATDLLRLGDEAEGWTLAQEVHEADAYDVTAYNLATLHDTLRNFVTLTNAHFIVRMTSREAAVYGPRVLDLLERARTRLVPRYGLALTQPTIVEIFANPNDFGVRTFGMPDNPGYLGVCFGRVITANSPAANRGHPVNWEAVLWHEFCHVVTLQLTANKMPRWLSEGISVFEERQANPAWGERLTPKYREMIRDGELTPVGRLSAAFLTPKSPLHLQFAYYQASLVVEFLVERFGLPKIQAILGDLRQGVFINETLEKHTLALGQLEDEFAAFARARAEELAPGLDWTKPGGRDLPKPVAALARKIPGLAADAAANPTNYYALRARAEQALERKDWTAAREPLETLVRLYPREAGNDSSSRLLAQVHRALGDVPSERAVLRHWAEIDDKATEAYLRLMELAAATNDWDEVLRNGDRFLAVDPLVPAPYRYLARAGEARNQPAAAIAAHRGLLQLDPPNPPAVHFDLARLLHPTEPVAARRHLLQALEDAPRHRGALEMLRRIGPGPAPSSTNLPSPTPKP